MPGDGEKRPAMASITIRNLADEVKTRLRVRAATNGRSMEARIILRGAVELHAGCCARTSPEIAIVSPRESR